MYKSTINSVQKTSSVFYKLIFSKLSTDDDVFIMLSDDVVLAYLI